MKLSDARKLLIPPLADDDARKKVVRIITKSIISEFRAQGYNSKIIFEMCTTSIEEFQKCLREELQKTKNP